MYKCTNVQMDKWKKNWVMWDKILYDIFLLASGRGTKRLFVRNLKALHDAWTTKFEVGTNEKYFRQ